jgi:hypothetical protein
MCLIPKLLNYGLETFNRVSATASIRVQTINPNSNLFKGRNLKAKTLISNSYVLTKYAFSPRPWWSDVKKKIKKSKLKRQSCGIPKGCFLAN